MGRLQPHLVREKDPKLGQLWDAARFAVVTKKGGDLVASAGAASRCESPPRAALEGLPEWGLAILGRF
jgi:hypothetical protein